MGLKYKHVQRGVLLLNSYKKVFSGAKEGDIVAGGRRIGHRAPDHASETASNLPRKHSTFTGFNKTIMEPLADNPLFARFESYL